MIADSRAADAFFEVYAAQRGLTLIDGRGPLPPATPLLRKGDDRYAERTLTGPLADGVDGTLALYTYEEETTDSEGNRETNYYRYTVGLVEVPECAAYVPELYCQRKFGLRALERFEDAFRGSKERVKLESEALDEQVRDLRQQGAGRRLAAPALLPHLHRLADRRGAGEVRLRARRRHPLLLRQRPQGERRRASTRSRAATARASRRGCARRPLE